MMNFNSYKALLAEFVKFQSISTDPKYKSEMDKTVSWLKNLFTDSGFSVKILQGKETNRVVFASYIHDEALPTFLIYGHYDVQPADQTDGWTANPFTMLATEKKLIARGIIDNKGQVLVHIFTAIQLIKEGKLNCNLKFLIEGNEETGNGDLAGIMAKNRDLLKCDVVIVSDGDLTNNKPTIEVSLRGGFSCTLTYQTAKGNLHSGLWGGAIPNAAYEMAKFLSKLQNPDNSVSFDGFYKGADVITKEQLKNNRNLVKDGGDIVKLAGVKRLLTEPRTDFYTQTGLKPTLQITGLKSGYIEAGYSNIVPFKAEARINVRLVTSQKPGVIARALENFVKRNTPKYVDYTLNFSGMHTPIKVDTENIYVKTAEKILTEVYGSKVNRRYVGGAIPFVGDVKSILGVDTLLVPLVNEDCNMHGTDENFEISLAQKALEFSRGFMSRTIRFYHLSDWKGGRRVVRKKT